MKIIKYNKLKQNKYKVVFDNDLEVEMFDDVIIKYNLLIKKELTENELKDILEVNDKYMAYYEGIKYINKKLRTKKEIEVYLNKKGYKDKDVMDAVDKLEKEGYLNNKLYIECFINDQVNLSMNGPFKIKDKLKELGLREEDIDNYLSSIKDDIWIDKARKIVNKKIKTNHKMSEFKLKEKIINDLVNMGYSKELVISLIDEVEIDDKQVIEKEYNLLYRKLSKKYEGKELELQLITKMMSRGFKYEVVKECIKKTNEC